MNRRWPALVLIPVLLVGALVFDQRSDTERSRRAHDTASSSTDTGVQLAEYMPVALPSDSLSSIWYCAGGTAEPNGIANQAVVISNPNRHRVTGEVTVLTSTGKQVVKPVDLPALSRDRVTLTDLVKAPYASAQVEVTGGQVAVEHEVSGPDGIDAGPCATDASSAWYFASGSTTLNASETLVLFNPFPDPATVNISFATPQGRRTPSAYEGFPVPGRSVAAVTIDAQVAVDPQVSTSVVAEQGRIVVDRLQTFDGKSPTGGPSSTATTYPKGLTVALGVPHPATTWLFPVGIKQQGAHEQFVIYNPGSKDASVAVAVSLVDPSVNGQVDPITVNVAAGDYQVVDFDKESRVPTRVDHSTVVLSTNHVPVVVDRLLATGSPYPAQGTATSSGSALVARRWLIASGGNVPNKLSERISVQNPGSHPVTVKALVVADGRIGLVKGVGPVTLGAYGHTVIRFSDKLDNRQASVLVEATGPIAAERLLFRLNTLGMSTAMGVPFPTGLALAPATAAHQ